MCAYNREEDNDEENRVGNKGSVLYLLLFELPTSPNIEERIPHVAIQDYYYRDSSHCWETRRDFALHRPATRQDCRDLLPISTTFYFVNVPIFTDDTLQLYVVML